MKVLYIHQYFKTPEEGGAIRSWHMTRALVKEGHSVTVITSHNSTKRITKEINGAEIIYLPVSYSQNFSTLARIRSFYHFATMAYKEGLKVNAEICFATSTPLTVGWTAIKLKKSKGTPFIFEVRDLWPEIPIQLGVLKDPVTKFFARHLEKKIYREARKIVALSPAIKTAVEEVIQGKEVSMIPNMADIDFYKKINKNENSVCQKNFTICYAGALGKANEVDALLKLAIETKKKELQVNYIISGEGSEFEELKKFSKQAELQNVSFTGHLSRNNLGKILDQSDAVYISYAKYPILQSGSPNKFFDALAAGKICITNTGGWVKELIENYNCGFYCPQDDMEKGCAILAELINDNAIIGEWKKNAGKLASKFSVPVLSKQFVQLFD